MSMDKLLLLYEKVEQLLNHDDLKNVSTHPTRIQALLAEEEALLEEANQELEALTPTEAATLIPTVQHVLKEHERLQKMLISKFELLIQKKETLGKTRSQIRKLRVYGRMPIRKPRLMDRKV